MVEHTKRENVLLFFSALFTVVGITLAPISCFAEWLPVWGHAVAVFVACIFLFMGVFMAGLNIGMRHNLGTPVQFNRLSPGPIKIIYAYFLKEDKEPIILEIRHQITGERKYVADFPLLPPEYGKGVVDFNISRWPDGNNFFALVSHTNDEEEKNEIN